MPIPVACLQCGARFKARDEALGQTLACPKCQGQIVVAAPAVPPSVVAPPPLPSKAPVVGGFPPPPTPTPAAPDGKLWTWLVLSSGGLALVVAVALFWYFGRSSPMESVESNPRTPKQISPKRVEEILGELGFDVPTDGIAESGNAVDGSMSMASFERRCPHKRHKGVSVIFVLSRYEYRNGKTESSVTVRSGNTTDWATLCGEIGGKLDAASETAIRESLAEFKNERKPVKRRVGELNIYVDVEKIALSWDMAEAPDSPQPQGPKDGSAQGDDAAKPKPGTADSIEQHLKAIGFDVPSGASVSTATISGGGIDGTMSWSPRIPRPFGTPQKASGNSFVQYIYDIENKRTGVKIAAHVESGRFFFFAPASDEGTNAIRQLLQRLDPRLPEKLTQLKAQFESAKSDAQRSGCRARLENVEVVVTSEGMIIASPDWPTIDGSFGFNYGLTGGGITSLMIAASAYKVDRVLALLEKGADPKAKTESGDTALHFLCAASHGYMNEKFGKIAEALIKKGADPNAKNADGEVPLDVAHTTRDGEMAKFMRGRGAKW